MRTTFSQRVRILAAALAAALALSGCGGLAADGSEGAGTTVRVSMYNDIAYSAWRTYVEKQCPDITIVWENNRNSTQNLIYQAKHGDMADIVTIRRFETDSAAALAPYLADLSGEALTDTFAEDTLSPFTVDGRVRWYPAPGMIEAVYANVSMFERYGVKIPETIGEMEDACRQFAAQGINGLSVNLSAGFRCTYLLEGFRYPTYFTRGAGREWLLSLLSGETVALPEEGGAALAGMLRELVDNSVLEAEDLTLSQADTLNAFDAEQSAMSVNGSDHVYSGRSGTSYQIIPCLGETADEQALYTYPIFSAAVSKTAAENPEKRAAVERLLEVMYSGEAQQILAQNADALISYNRDIDLPVSELYRSVADLIAEKKCLIRFLNRNMFSASALAVQEMLEDGLSDADFTATFNAALCRSADTTVIGTSRIAAGNQLGEDYPLERSAASVLAQTAQDATGADVALIEGKCAAAPIYKGDYTEDDLNAVIADEPLYEAELTGAQLSSVFDDAVLGTTTYTYLDIEPIVDYPALSGMTAYLAANGRDNELRLPDGSAIDPNADYRVAVSRTILSALTYLQNENAASFAPAPDTLLSAFRARLVSGELPEPQPYFEVEVLS